MGIVQIKWSYHKNLVVQWKQIRGDEIIWKNLTYRICWSWCRIAFISTRTLFSSFTLYTFLFLLEHPYQVQSLTFLKMMANCKPKPLTMMLLSDGFIQELVRGVTCFITLIPWYRNLVVLRHTDAFLLMRKLSSITTIIMSLLASKKTKKTFIRYIGFLHVHFIHDRIKDHFISNSSSCTTTELYKQWTSRFTAVKNHLIKQGWS